MGCIIVMKRRTEAPGLFEKLLGLFSLSLYHRLGEDVYESWQVQNLSVASMEFCWKIYMD